MAKHFVKLGWQHRTSKLLKKLLVKWIHKNIYVNLYVMRQMTNDMEQHGGGTSMAWNSMA
jgi:hypothetical protein